MALISRTSLIEDLTELGVTSGGVVLVHCSLSSIGQVDGGAPTVVDAFRTALGPRGTLVTPAFSGTITDPCRSGIVGATDPDVWATRDQVPLYDPATTPTETGAIPTAVLAEPGRRRSPHPQASVAAVGADADAICRDQPLSFALGENSPFSRLVELDATIVLLGVGHNRSSMLHHVESLLPPDVRRHWVRRFPHRVDGERVWVEARDVAADNSTHFPAVGAAFASTSTTHRRGRIGDAPTEVFSSREYVAIALAQLGRRLRATGR
ncbi:aminoglycoside N(3)-acetyltransferase [uncultured Williamsia sp.]|uniref:aminoglycoside N(3)-acetyltransferase n=1 Tax=uncultured Williamsia sp. TaxID=259311 RepID=UPI00262971A0|nr:AAC(3) family N-acetyltransferase [uncultured Williamsia sp.]